MTDSEHAALSAQLARALGYYPESVKIVDGKCFVFRVSAIMQESGIKPHVNFWHFFDYKCPTVYGPLIEWLGNEKNVWVIPSARVGKWCIQLPRTMVDYIDTLAEAVARACIAVKKGSK